MVLISYFGKYPLHEVVRFLLNGSYEDLKEQIGASHLRGIVNEAHKDALESFSAEMSGFLAGKAYMRTSFGCTRSCTYGRDVCKNCSGFFSHSIDPRLCPMQELWPFCWTEFAKTSVKRKMDA
jgi:hypothetical protein